MEIIGAIGASNVAGIAQAVASSAVVGGLLCYELPSKIAGRRPGEVSVRSYVKGGLSVASRCLPEMIGVCTVLCIAVFLRLRGDTEIIVDPATIQVWEDIKKEWWFLMGADTLLNLQAMLRLLMMLFVAVRADSNGRSPLSGMASIFFLSSMMARSTLSTRTSAYRLEGPLSLGGDLSIACEAAMIPFFASLSREAFRRFPVAAAAIGLATMYTRNHYFDLAEMKSDDSLFTLAHVLELFGAFAYLIRTISLYCTSTVETRSTGIIGFMQFLMPAQQALAAYYWLTAFEPGKQLPVARGKPWCLLILTNLLQLGAFLCSLALYVGERFGTDKSPTSEESSPSSVEIIDQAEVCAFARMAGQTTSTAISARVD